MQGGMGRVFAGLEFNSDMASYSGNQACLDPSIILPYTIDVLALEEKPVLAIPLRINTQACYASLL